MRLVQEVSDGGLFEPLAIELDQARLNIEMRTRTSRLPWRGQFSPELVEYLIDRVCPDSRCLLDPFCGSGTVLYEALHKEKDSIGAEVNPAAWHLATLASFSTLPTSEKQFVLNRVKEVTANLGFIEAVERVSGENVRLFLDAIDHESHPFVRRALAAVVLLGMGNENRLTPSAIARGGFATITLLNSLKSLSGDAECHLADARHLPLDNASVDGVITSPPYINVFNYHQNYRPAAELLGWFPLEAARSEIGANRKHRANRFLTVVQYAMDMAQCFSELSRVMRPDAPLVIILGRTSNVLGVSFENGAIISDLIRQSGSFDAIQRAERFFINRYGERIYEDILIARCIGRNVAELEKARSVGVASLVSGRAIVSKENRLALESAISMAAEVQPSPMLSIAVPEHSAHCHKSPSVLANAGN